MSKKDCKLTLDRLHQVLDYNKETGVFVWKHRDKHKEKLGKVATTSLMYCYLGVSLDGVKYPAHRLAFFYVHGYWPKIVDHINGDKLDNRIENLRNVDEFINTQNIHKARKNNKNNLLGVYVFEGRYKSCIRVNKKSLHLGTFDSKELAHEAYLQAKRKYHDGCTI